MLALNEPSIVSIGFLALSHFLLIPANFQVNRRLWWDTILQFALIILLALDVMWKIHKKVDSY